MVGNDNFATVQIEQDHLALIGQCSQAVKRLICRLGIRCSSSSSSRSGSSEPRKLRLADQGALQCGEFEFFLELDLGQRIN